MDNQLTILEALVLLKKHMLLVANVQNSKSYFFMKEKYICVLTNNSSFKLKEEDFLDLFKDTKFYIKDDENSIDIDIEKDKEYYSWRQ